MTKWVYIALWRDDRGKGGIGIVEHTYSTELESSCERGRGGRGEGRLHRRLGATPKAICISHRVFWNSSQSRLNSTPILCPAHQPFLTRHSFPPCGHTSSVHFSALAALVSCLPIHNECRSTSMPELLRHFDRRTRRQECGRCQARFRLRIMRA